MYEHLDFTIRGIAPLICHNGQLADPLNPIAVKMKEVSGKRKKTDADHIELGRLEFLGGLYIGDDGAPCIPGINIEAMLIDAAKKTKMGNQAKAGIISDGNWPIVYEGPKNPDKMWDSGKFSDRRGVKLGGTTTVIRTRPIFRNWSLKFTVSYLPSLLNKKQIADFVGTAGQIIGLGDFVPKFGRFEIAA